MTIGKVTVKFQVVDIFQELYQKDEGTKRRGNEGTKRRKNEGTTTRGNEKTRTRGNEGTKARGNEGTKRRGHEGTRERGDERTQRQAREVQRTEMNGWVEVVYAHQTKKLPSHRAHSNTFTTLEAGFSKALPTTFIKTEGSSSTKQTQQTE